MVMKSGEHWYCTNPACRRPVPVENTGEMAGQNPRCACGSTMKRLYSPPHIHYLDFLRFPEPAVTRWNSKE